MTGSIRSGTSEAAVLPASGSAQIVLQKPSPGRWAGLTRRMIGDRKAPCAEAAHLAWELPDHDALPAPPEPGRRGRAARGSVPVRGRTVRRTGRCDADVRVRRASRGDI